MQLYVLLNLDDLTTAWTTHAPADPRFQNWLHHTVLNELNRALPVRSWLGLTLFNAISPAEYAQRVIADSRVGLATSKPYDPYALDEVVLKHAQLGGALLQLEADFTEHIQQLNHLYEGMLNRLSGHANWRVTVAQAQRLAAEWVAELNRRAEEKGGETKLVYTSGPWTVHLLVDQVAYKVEGKTMSHCVASYWGRKCKIYSVRNDDNRVATVEVSEDNTYIVQVRGYKNQPPIQAATEFISAWANETGIIERTTVISDNVLLPGHAILDAGFNIERGIAMGGGGGGVGMADGNYSMAIAGGGGAGGGSVSISAMPRQLRSPGIATHINLMLDHGPIVRLPVRSASIETRMAFGGGDPELSLVVLVPQDYANEVFRSLTNSRG
jgi:hypothetical protein